VCVYVCNTHLTFIKYLLCCIIEGLTMRTGYVHTLSNCEKHYRVVKFYLKWHKIDKLLHTSLCKFTHRFFAFYVIDF